jgi:hypothetical protein
VFFAGSQAVEINTSAASGQTGPYRVDTSPASDTIVTMQAEVMLTSSSVQTAWQFAGLTGSLGTFFGGFNALADGTLQIITTGFPVTTPVITRDVWNLWEVDYDFKTQTFSILINGSLVAANEPFLNPATAFGTGLFDTFNATGGNDLGFIDNYSIAGGAAPEPGTFVLFGMGCLILFVSTKMKRRTFLRASESSSRNTLRFGM